MRHRTFLARVAFPLTLAFPTLGFASEATDDVQSLEQAFYESFTDIDAAAMGALMSDDFVYQHGSGTNFTKEEFLALIDSRAAVVTRADDPALSFHDFGDTVIAYGASRVEGEMGDTPFGAPLRFVNVWHRGEGGWKLHHRNSEFLPEE